VSSSISGRLAVDALDADVPAWAVDRPGVANSGTDLQLRMYEDALESKRLVLFGGDHFASCVKEGAVALGAAMTWFSEHLKP